jgi:hypothetical protein
VTAPAAVPCPRSGCSNELPAGGFHAPCPPCRVELNRNAETDFARRLEAVELAIAEGWTCDDARRCWARTEPCGPCDGTGFDAGQCKPCKGTGSVEALVEWGV